VPPPILFVHGMWSRARVFDTLRAELLAAGIESAAITLPFHDLPRGAAPPAGLAAVTLEDYVAAAVAEARALGPDAVLAGHSMGGLVVQRAAEQLRLRGLVLLATAPSAAAQAFALSPARALSAVVLRRRWWERPTLLDARGARFGVFHRVPGDEAEEAIADLTWDSGRVLAQIAFPGCDPSAGSRVSYERIGAPSLIVVGAEDRMTPASISRRTAARLAAAGAPTTFELLPATGHWLFHRAARPRVAAAIARFLASL
jgi:pimeloyl-ACP methyl ester carboxylesterase